MQQSMFIEQNRRILKNQVQEIIGVPGQQDTQKPDDEEMKQPPLSNYA